MPKQRRILIADNSYSLRESYAELLELHGYQVYQAASPEECLHAVEKDLPHLVILDLRLRDDTDQEDVSGLTLAQHISPSIPKIILTANPTWEMARTALSFTEQSLPPAVSFVGKNEGFETFLTYVKRAFDKHVGINWDLEIDWKEHNPFSLVRLIEPEIVEDGVSQRATELEDLFRRLFFSGTHVKIDRLLWRKAGRIALQVFAFGENNPSEPLLVVCGSYNIVSQEAIQYRKHAPKSSKLGIPTLHSSAATAHLAANAYAFDNCSLGGHQSLSDLYKASTGKYLAATLSTLFDQVLNEWSQRKRIIEPTATLDELYRTRLKLSSQQFDQPTLAAGIETLLRRLPLLGVHGELRDGKITLRTKNASFTYPDPTLFVHRATTIGQPVLLSESPGELSGETILIDENKQVWVTDFAYSGTAPLFWDYVSLEAAIRFDWIERVPIEQLHELEQCLVNEDFTHLDYHEFDVSLRKPLHAIRTIRRLASQHADQDPLTYHLGIFFHAVARLTHISLTAPLAKSELERLAHLLFSLAIIARRMETAQSGNFPLLSKKHTGLQLDFENASVLVDGRRVRLTPQQYKLLRFLYERANQLSTRQTIAEQVFGIAYDENDKSQQGLIEASVSRLRNQLEPNPGGNPRDSRYIINERGKGYRLVLPELLSQAEE